MMTPMLLVLFALSLIGEVVAHVAFKLGADQVVVAPPGPVWWRTVLRMAWAWLRVSWLWVGVGIHLVELLVWLAILERVPLGIAFPIASLNYCGVILASRWWLKERVSSRRWAGAGLITLGVAIVGTGAGG